MPRLWAVLAVLLLSSCDAGDPSPVIRSWSCDAEGALAPDSATECWSIEGAYDSARTALDAALSAPGAAEELNALGTVDVAAVTCPRPSLDSSALAFDFLCEVAVLDPNGAEKGYLTVSQLYDQTDLADLEQGQSINGFVLSFVPRPVSGN